MSLLFPIILNLNSIFLILGTIRSSGSAEIRNYQINHHTYDQKLFSKTISHNSHHHRQRMRNVDSISNLREEDPDISELIISSESSETSYRTQGQGIELIQQKPEIEIHRNSIVKERPNTLPCPGCQRGVLESKRNSENMRNLRLELIKEKILKKLRLKEPPNTFGMEILPDPLIHSTNHNARVSHSNDMEDYYGKTEQVIVFAEEVVVNSICPTRRATPSTCLTFKLPSEVLREKVEVRVSSAELWVYKFEADLEFRDRVFTIDEISGNDSHNGSISTRLDPIQIVNNSVGWDAIKVSVTVGAWINRTIRFRIEKALTLQIGCRNCTNIYWYGSMSPIYNGNVPNRPFLVIKMAEAVQKNRRRRNINCQNGPSECCRESFRVSFSQIGWNWIIQPKEFDAFYCKGSCDSRSSRHHHTSAMQAYTREVASGNETVAKLLLPCCSPMKLEGITILYSLNNSNIQIQKNLPNMVVESCGCFGA